MPRSRSKPSFFVGVDRRLLVVFCLLCPCVCSSSPPFSFNFTVLSRPRSGCSPLLDVSPPPSRWTKVEAWPLVAPVIRQMLFWSDPTLPVFGSFPPPFSGAFLFLPIFPRACGPLVALFGPRGNVTHLSMFRAKVPVLYFQDFLAHLLPSSGGKRLQFLIPTGFFSPG